MGGTKVAVAKLSFSIVATLSSESHSTANTPDIFGVSSTPCAAEFVVQKVMRESSGIPLWGLQVIRPERTAPGAATQIQTRCWASFRRSWAGTLRSADTLVPPYIVQQQDRACTSWVQCQRSTRAAPRQRLASRPDGPFRSGVSDPPLSLPLSRRAAPGRTTDRLSTDSPPRSSPPPPAIAEGLPRCSAC